MGKTTKVVVCGMKGVGKTAILEQAIYKNYTKDTFLQATVEDIYVAWIETERGTKEKVRFYDTAGLESIQQARLAGQTDAYVLVYDTARPETFDFLVTLKKEIDRNKEKKELLVVLLGHNITQVESPIPLESPASKAAHWSMREKIRHFEVNALDRATLFEPLVYLASRLNQPPNKSSFPQLSMVRKSVKIDSS